MPLDLAAFLAFLVMFAAEISQYRGFDPVASVIALVCFGIGFVCLIIDQE
jgi:hypothetical protein